MIHIYDCYPALESYPMQVCTKSELAYTFKEFQQFDVTQRTE